MKPVLRILVGVATLLAWTGPVSAQGLTYWGKVPDGTNRGRVQYLGQYYDVREGDEIPGWGRVEAVTDEGLVVRRSLTDADRTALGAQGLPAVDAQELHLPNRARTLAPR